MFFLNQRAGWPRGTRGEVGQEGGRGEELASTDPHFEKSSKVRI